MRKNSAVSVEKPGEFQDELTALLRRGAQQLLLQAVETELEMFLEDNKQLPEAWVQRCWVHKIANVLNKVPKSVQPRMKQALHEIMRCGWQRPGRMPTGPLIYSWTNTRLSIPRQ